MCEQSFVYSYQNQGRVSVKRTAGMPIISGSNESRARSRDLWSAFNIVGILHNATPLHLDPLSELPMCASPAGVGNGDRAHFLRLVSWSEMENFTKNKNLKFGGVLSGEISNLRLFFIKCMAPSWLKGSCMHSFLLSRNLRLPIDKRIIIINTWKMWNFKWHLESSHRKWRRKNKIYSGFSFSFYEAHVSAHNQDFLRQLLPPVSVISQLHVC